jgi:biopolymer transport protein ExbD
MGVLFLLVIFLVFKSYIVHPSGIKISLPAVDGATPVTGNYLLLGIDSSGQLYYDNQLLTETELREVLVKRVGELEDDVTLLIYADANVTFEDITQIGSVAAEAGITQITQMVKP